METDSVQNMRDHQLKHYWLVYMKEMNLFSSFQSSRSLLYSRKPEDINNSTQDDLMTEDIFILDCHSEISVCVGQQVDSKSNLLALTIGEWSRLLTLGIPETQYCSSKDSARNGLSDSRTPTRE